ncbi:unnamed protein product, partial [Brassica oleracea var. botrytis]
EATNFLEKPTGSSSRSPVGSSSRNLVQKSRRKLTRKSRRKNSLVTGRRIIQQPFVTRKEIF